MSSSVLALGFQKPQVIQGQIQPLTQPKGLSLGGVKIQDNSRPADRPTEDFYVIVKYKEMYLKVI